MLIRIIGIGSPFGDDAVGLEAARILAEAPPANCDVISADRPGATLVELLDGIDAAILIDAVCSGAPVGKIHELQLDEIDGASGHLTSSHDLDVAAAVQLARKLGCAPSYGRLIGLEIGSERPGRMCGLSSTSREAMGKLVARVRSCAAELSARERVRLLISGTVQGVGMRPFVWRLAQAMELTGFVRNVAAGVQIEIEGARSRLAEFRRRLIDDLPPAAKIEKVEIVTVPLSSEREFSVAPSERGRISTMIPPDLAICADCAREILDPADRRYGYPFTNCVSCGPRFTIARALPYDRETTTLAAFALCEKCRCEYFDPSNRRFRAEAIACSECGPRAWLESKAPRWGGVFSTGEDPIGKAAAIVREGGIIAVRGLGGVHLACEASNEIAVARLRDLKGRRHKPLAVMVQSVEYARKFAVISNDEAALLSAPSAPIVLLRKLPGTDLAAAIAPGNDHIGVMIAYSPMHQLLAQGVGRPLVITSANRPGEPLACDGAEARSLFWVQVDALLLHNRPIHQRCDDAVWMVGPGGAQPIRLSRGNTPYSITTSVASQVPILAVGGDIKNSFCILSGNEALMSQHIGSLGNAATQRHFRDTLKKWIAMSGITPEIAAHDLHPQSFARLVIAQLGLKAIGVQHHHAHIAACLAEYGERGPVIGIVLDGAGYGLDGSIWGGEVLVADFTDFRRVSHFEYLPLAGGDAAVRYPRRIAAGFLIGSFGRLFDAQVRTLVGEEHAGILTKMVERGINTFQTSSCGRLFDAVAGLLGICEEATYEAQAAIELETLARTSPPTNRIYPFSMREGIISTSEILGAIVGDLEQRMPTAKIARAFHETMAEVARRVATDARTKTGIDWVALSGGCFQNRLLLATAVELLEREGLNVLVHHRVPANDGGLALGQAVVAATRLNSTRADQLEVSSCASQFPVE